MTASARLRSLDVFRGATIAAMMLVNSPGNEHAYAWLEHAEWHGLTPTDWIFPFFLFIVGVSLAVSLGKRLAEGASRETIVKHVFKRALILFVLGIFLNGFYKYDLSTLRVYGVLQRIALAYLGGALLYLWLPRKEQFGALIAILLGYWVLLYGDLSPEGNLGARIDRFLLSGHLYKPHYDPEGLLSTFPAIGTVLLGALSAKHIKSAQLEMAGAVCFAVGLLWSLIFPINKALWTSSYVLVTGGLAMGFLRLCYWMVDVKGWERPFRWLEALGLNAIAAYVGHLLFLKIQNRIPVMLPDGSMGNLRLWITSHVFSPWLSPVNASLAYALVYSALWAWIFWALYRRRVFIKI